MKNKGKLILITILSILSSMCFTISVSKKFVFSYDWTLMTILFFIFFIVYKNSFKDKKIIFKLLSLIFGIFMVIGETFDRVGNFSLIFHNFFTILFTICKIFGFASIFCLLVNKVYDFFENLKYKNNKNKIINFIFEKHSIIMPCLILLLFYLPYIISFYPAILSPDPSNQIRQFFHIETNYLNYSVLLDPNVYITSHHPVLHTVILGGLTKLGTLMGSANLGLFMYTILQMSLLIFTLSYTINYMKKLKVPYMYRIIILAIYALVPVFPFYGMSALKDVVFSCLTILYTIKIFDYIRFKPIYKLKDYIILSVLMLLIMMTRNNGIYAILFTMPLVIIFIKNNRIKNTIMTVSVIFLYLIYGKFLVFLKITPGSVREKYSIPFQQTARYVKYYDNEISDEDKEIIDKVLGYDTLAKRYNPVKSDPVKNEFNKYATSEDLSNYFKVWFKYLFKRPNVYIEATLHNTYGYFYPNASNWYIYTAYDERLKDSGIDYHFNDFEGSRAVLTGYGESFMYYPVVGWICNIAINVWIFMMIVNFLIHKKLYKYLIFLMSNLSLILTCFASPVNTYFRYTIGFVFATPIMLCIYFHLAKNGGEVNEKV